jgi:RNA polymerase sigma-70 factor (ECF subfamily)
MSVEPVAETNGRPAGNGKADSESRRVSEEIGWALRHAPLLRPLIARRTRPLDCCDEVLQEVWLAATRARHVPVDPDQQVCWLAKVAIRQAAMALRSWGRRQRREATYAEQQDRRERDADCDPAAALLADERRTLLREQLERMPDQQRTLLQMKYVQGWTYREIAQRTGMDLTAVEYQLAKARRQLRVRLVEAGIEGDRGNG